MNRTDDQAFRRGFDRLLFSIKLRHTDKTYWIRSIVMRLVIHIFVYLCFKYNYTSDVLGLKRLKVRSYEK